MHGTWLQANMNKLGRPFHPLGHSIHLFNLGTSEPLRAPRAQLCMRVMIISLTANCYFVRYFPSRSTRVSPHFRPVISTMFRPVIQFQIARRKSRKSQVGLWRKLNVKGAGGYHGHGSWIYGAGKGGNRRKFATDTRPAAEKTGRKCSQRYCDLRPYEQL